METGLFEIQAKQLEEFKRTRQALPASREVVYALFGRAHSVSYDRDPASDSVTNAPTVPSSGSKSVEPAPTVELAPVPSSGSKSVEPAPTVELARCFLRLANLPNFALDRLSRYEATLWRQAGRILYALDALDRRNPQERRHRFCVDAWRKPPTSEDDDR